MIVNRYLLPLSGTVDVSVLDTSGAPVRQWVAVPLDKGILSDELLLADEPALGQWTVQVCLKQLFAPGETIFHSNITIIVIIISTNMFTRDFLVSIDVINSKFK